MLRCLTRTCSCPGRWRVAAAQDMLTPGFARLRRTPRQLKCRALAERRHLPGSQLRTHRTGSSMNLPFASCFPQLPVHQCWPESPAHRLRGCFPALGHGPTRQDRASSNERVLQPGAAAGRALTRLDGTVSTSLIHGAAGTGVARSRRANR